MRFSFQFAFACLLCGGAAVAEQPQASKVPTASPPHPAGTSSSTPAATQVVGRVPARPVALAGVPSNWGQEAKPPAAIEEQLVRILVDRREVGVGVVLASGQVLTSLSAIGRGREMIAERFDGSRLALRVFKSHRGFDLALLVVAGSPLRGVELSSRQEFSKVLVPTGTRSRTVRFESTGVVRALGADSIELPNALLARADLALGTPVFDAENQLSGLQVLACVPHRRADEPAQEPGPASHETPEPWSSAAKVPCEERGVVLSASFIGKFLASHRVGDSEGWLGVRVEPVDSGWVRGLRLISVETGSPAEQAGLLGAGLDEEGDVLVALNGVPLGTPSRLERMLSSLLPGTEVDLLLLHENRFEHRIVRLGAQPTLERAWQLNPPLIQPPNPWQGL